MKIPLSLIVGAGAIFVAPFAAHADHALVAGINEYPSLVYAAHLQGCGPDAEAMGAALVKYGFEVTVLKNMQATRAGILDALRTLGAQNTGKERFVFYYAGHGGSSANGVAALLPADALEGASTNDLTADDLNAAVAAIPARGRTVILDSCHSAGMMKSFGLRKNAHKALATRYYARELGGTEPVRANQQDRNPGVGRICYFTAARASEQSAEDDFDGVRHGVFMYYLLQQLTGEKRHWGDLQTTVSGGVGDRMDDQQHPTLSPAYVDQEMFEGASAPPSPGPQPAPSPPGPAVDPKIVTVWDDYNADHMDLRRVQLTLNPDLTAINVGQEISFKVKVGSSGYLVILERGVSGHLNLLFPKRRRGDDALVQAGQVINIPDGDNVYTPDAPGTERVKAILFSSQERANALVEQFPSSLSVQGLRSARDLVEKQTVKGPFYTSDVTFEVVTK